MAANKEKKSPGWVLNTKETLKVFVHMPSVKLYKLQCSSSSKCDCVCMRVCLCMCVWGGLTCSTLLVLTETQVKKIVIAPHLQKIIQMRRKPLKGPQIKVKTSKSRKDDENCSMGGRIPSFK